MSQHQAIHFGRYRLHPVQGLHCGAERVAVTPKALRVLWELLSHADQLVTKEELFQRVWSKAVVSDAALTSCIQELRRVLADDARAPRFIQTQHRRGFRFIGRASRASPESPGIETRTVRHFVGREAATMQLMQAWCAARAGARQLVFVTGEAGIGKTTLVEHFLDAVTVRDEAKICLTACVERFGVFEAYQPLLEALPRLCAGTDRRKRIAVLRRCAPTWLMQMPALQYPSESAALQRRTAGSTPERMLRELTDALESLAKIRPLILCIEDVHCSDTATLDWLVSFAQGREPAAVLVVCTLRTGEPVTGARAAQSILEALCLRGACRSLPLPRLDEAAVRDYVHKRFPAATGETTGLEDLSQAVFRHSEGNPLFLAHILTDLIARGSLAKQDYPATPAAGMPGKSLGIPDNIRLTIEQQVGRLTPAEQHLLEVASVSPATCTAAVIAAAAGLTPAAVEAMLTPLARRGAFVREVQASEWPDGTISATFEFLHALYREVLYSRIPAGQRAQLHRDVAARLERAYGSGPAQIAGELAMHFERARALPQAARYLLRAAETDAGRSAHQSAQRHYRHALALIENLPPSAERDLSEAASRMGLGSVLTQLRGWGAIEVEHEYARAQALGERHGAHDLTFSASWNLWVGSIARGQVEDAHARAKAVFALACCSGRASARLQGHHAQWTTAYARGDFQQVPVHVRAGIALYDSVAQSSQAYGSHDTCVCALAFRARAAAVSGRLSMASRDIEAAITLARQIGHPFTLSFALMHASAVWLEVGKPATALRCAAEAARVAEEQGFSLMLAWSTCFRGAAMSALGQNPEGVNVLAAGIAKAQSTGSDMFLPHFQSLMAEAQIRVGSYADAHRNLDDALSLVDRTGERSYLADLHRLRGQLGFSDRGDSTIDVRQELRVALRTARQQGARLLAAKAALDLSRVLERDGERTEASALIAEARAGLADADAGHAAALPVS
jgi:DNA-binding winged helix-turn-helix (wHTH) protein